jgi:hypothetical protein
MNVFSHQGSLRLVAHGFAGPNRERAKVCRNPRSPQGLRDHRFCDREGDLDLALAAQDYGREDDMPVLTILRLGLEVVTLSAVQDQEPSTKRDL